MEKDLERSPAWRTAVRTKAVLFIGLLASQWLCQNPAQAETHDKLYATVIRGTVWINAGETTATGCLVDRGRRLVVTSWHVVEERKTVDVVFPVYRRGALIRDREFFWRHRKTLAIRAQVVHRDKGRDLAIVRLATLPGNARAVPLARQEVEPGDKVYRLGSPAAEHEAWKIHRGWVRWQRTHQMKYKESNQVVNCVLLKSDMVSHPGNSGGPVVNERGELVGIHCAAADGDKVSYAVSLKEVQAVLAKTQENVRAESRQRE
jgi:S1-C subfamily serine protease